MLEMGEEPWVIAFHAQQAVEKALKAYLILKNKHFGKIHNIARLIDLCTEVDRDFKQLHSISIDTLYPLAIEARYPDTEIEVARDEAEEAVRKAEQALKFVLNKMGYPHNSQTIHRT